MSVSRAGGCEPQESTCKAPILALLHAPLQGDSTGPAHLQVRGGIWLPSLHLGWPRPRRQKEAPEVTWLLVLLAHSSEEQSSPSADAGWHTAPSPVTQPGVKTTTRVLTLKYKIGFTFEKQSMLFTVFTNQKSKTVQSTQQAQKVLDKIQHPFLRKKISKPGLKGNVLNPPTDRRSGTGGREEKRSQPPTRAYSHFFHQCWRLQSGQSEQKKTERKKKNILHLWTIISSI